jgi:predicted esterase
MAMKSCLVLLHGSGSCGADITSYLRNVPLPDFDYRTFVDVAHSLSIKIITPTAVTRPYSAMGGELCNVWFDRSADFIDQGMEDTEDTMGINASLQALELQLDQLDAHFEHIFFGGFSMGGGLALHVLRRPCLANLRGIFTMGSFLVNGSVVQKKKLTPVPVLMMHGKCRNQVQIFTSTTCKYTWMMCSHQVSRIS